MARYEIQLEIEDGRIEEINDRIDLAMREIRDCYEELVNLGFAKIKKEADSGN